MKTFKYFILIIAAFSIWACEDMDFIQEAPKSDYALTGVNADVLESLVLGTYEPLARSRGRLWESLYSSFIELQGEYVLSVGGGSFAACATFNFPGILQSELAAVWTTFYQAIGRANFLIESVEKNSTLADNVKNKALGEARFIRALCYYQLVRSWGKVPMRLLPVTDANSTAEPLAEIDAIYKQIIADLQYAESTLPAKVVSTGAGRATKGAASTMLADVYLTLKDYPNARAKSLEVMTNKVTYGYNLETSLTTLFSPTAATNVEEIFAIKFAQIRAQGNFLAAYAHDTRAKDAGLAARGLARFSAYKKVPLIRDWDGRDLRKTWNLYDTITINNVKIRANIPLSGDFLFGKYRDGAAPEETAAGNDFYIYRYADALLIFAEAENQINGPTPAAYDAINQVRRRGYGVNANTPNTVADLPPGLAKTAFDDLVFRERGYEFFFEAKRWFDLKRTGRLVKIVAESGIKTLPANSEYWPIPNVEKANNPAIPR